MGVTAWGSTTKEQIMGGKKKGTKSTGGKGGTKGKGC